LRRGDGRDSGTASAMVLAVLALLSALFVAAAAFVELSSGELDRGRRRDAERARLTGLASAAVALLLDDPTPEADSPFDPVWSGTLPAGRGMAAEINLSQAPPGYSVVLEDLSSRLGINWVGKDLLARLEVLNPGVTPQDVQQYREDTGLHLDPAAYARFVSPQSFDALFTTWGWFNVNVADEFALRKAALARTGDLALAEDLRDRVQRARIRRTPTDPLHLIGPDEIADFLGPAYAQVDPVIGAEPAMNVHFVPARVVEALAALYNVDKAVSDRILAERATREIDARQLKDLLGDGAVRTPLAHYLGVRTWFWRVAVTGPSLKLEWVLAREPDRPKAARHEARLRVVEEQWVGP
jgi:hypothetical protein